MAEACEIRQISAGSTSSYWISVGQPEMRRAGTAPWSWRNETPARIHARNVFGLADSPCSTWFRWRAIQAPPDSTFLVSGKLAIAGDRDVGGVMASTGVELSPASIKTGQDIWSRHRRRGPRRHRLAG